MVTLRNSESLKAVLAIAVSATQLPIVVEFDEVAGGRSSERTGDAVTTDDTAVTVLAGNNTPRKVKSLSVHNSDSASATVTFTFVNASATSRILKKAVLLTNESLHWNQDRGWYALDASGNLKQTTASDVTASSSQASSMAALVPASVSSQASSIAVTNPHTVSSIQSVLSVASFTSVTWATVSSAASRVKSSFTW